MDNQVNQQVNQSVWAIVELMGHVSIVGKLSSFNGIWQIDVPDTGDNGEHTEYFGNAAIYRIRIVSEEIARAHAAAASRQVIEYSAPIVTRAEHLAEIARYEAAMNKLEYQVAELKRRLVAVNALPAGDVEDSEN